MGNVGRRTRQKVIAGAAVAVLVAGGAVAAVSATGQSNDGKRARHGFASRSRARELSTAAAYLGVSQAQLSSELRAGKSLAQIAEATGGGRSTKGLIEALEASKKAKLDAVASSLAARVTADVNRPGGPVASRASGAARLRALFAARRQLGESAASYLGTTSATLKRELRSGKSLAQIADATAGKSKDGLVAALVAAWQRTPAASAASRSLSAAQRAKREQRLERRVTHLVQRHFAAAPAS
jgi:hypothetical protein